jgi:hypothetical protein
MVHRDLSECDIALKEGSSLEQMDVMAANTEKVGAK